MANIEIQVNDGFILEFGLQHIKEKLEEHIKILILQSLSDDIRNGIENSNIDFIKEMDISKEKAWKEYHNKYLKHIIK